MQPPANVPRKILRRLSGYGSRNNRCRGNKLATIGSFQVAIAFSDCKCFLQKLYGLLRIQQARHPIGSIIVAESRCVPSTHTMGAYQDTRSQSNPETSCAVLWRGL